MSVNTLINGQADGVISPLDRGFQYGDGLFETIWVESGCVTFLSLHLARLNKGCERLGFPLPDVGVISDEITQLVSEYQNGVIKITLTRGIGKRGFLPPDEPNITRVISFNACQHGITTSLLSTTLRLCETRLSKQPLLAGIKHLNQLERVLAKTELRGLDKAEGLMLDIDGAVIEGTMSNLFIVKADVLITPELNNCGVSGVVRNCLIQQAKADGMACEIAVLMPDEVLQADEVFMTNSLMPIRSVNQLTMAGKTIYKDEHSRAQWALDSILTMMRQGV